MIQKGACGRWKGGLTPICLFQEVVRVHGCGKIVKCNGKILPSHMSLKSLKHGTGMEKNIVHYFLTRARAYLAWSWSTACLYRCASATASPFPAERASICRLEQKKMLSIELRSLDLIRCQNYPRSILMPHYNEYARDRQTDR